MKYWLEMSQFGNLFQRSISNGKIKINGKLSWFVDTLLPVILESILKYLLQLHIQ